MNRVVLVGRLANEVELRYSQQVKAWATFRLAVDRQQKGQDGKREADFFPVIVFGKQAESCANNLNKGRLVAVEGRLQNRSFTTRDGSRRWATEVVADSVRFLDWPKDGGQDEAAVDDGAGYDDGEMQEDDLPF